MRHAERIQNFLVKSDVDLSGGGKTLHMKRTQKTKHRAMLLDFWSEFLFENKINDDKQPGRLGHLDTYIQDIIALIKDENVSYNGSWKYSPEGRSAGKDHELQSALAKMKKHKPKVLVV